MSQVIAIGCPTRRWSEGLDVSASVVDLLAAEPDLFPAFDELHALHGRRLSPVMRWGSALTTTVRIDARRSASMLTSCTKRHRLTTTCWVSNDRPRRRH